MNIKSRSLSVMILLVALSFRPCLGQDFHKDTLRVNLQQSEKMFLDSNFQLLAQKYNIDAQRALIIQARLWPNPNLSLSRGPFIPLYDPSSQFPHSNFVNNSENAATLSQLILLAGKRNKQIKLAQANTTLAEYQFYDLLRTLKYTLRSDYFNIYYLEQSARVYDAEIRALQQIVNAFAQQEGKGYISEKEVVRIRAQLYSFQSEYNDLIIQIKGLQSELRLVLQVKFNIYIEPVPDTETIQKLDPLRYSLSILLDSAYHNRTDLLIARQNTQINRLNYNYQKALAVPDLDASVSWDRQGSYAINYNGLGIDMDLPFLNRNQGNIKSAKAQIANTVALEKSAEATVNENVNNSLEIAFAQDKLYQSIDPKFSNDFERLVSEVLINYQKRNIGLLDFLDFYDSYKQNVLQINSIKYNRIQAFEDLNFYTGTNFFN
jgi:cobalt-zinc-cadmium efflux system outer membrane protein